MQERIRYYNPGLRIEETFSYTRDTGDTRLNNISRWYMDAPEDGFFYVPVVIQIDGSRYNVMFESDVQRRFGDRGVVPCETEPASTDSEIFAKELKLKEDEIVKGAKAVWKSFCEEIAKKHLEQCLNCKAAGMPPLPAKGFTKQALRVAGVEDPADAWMQLLKESSAEGDRARKERDQMQTELANLRNQVNTLQGQSRQEISEYQRASARLYDAHVAKDKRAIKAAEDALDAALARATTVSRDTSRTIPGQKEPEELEQVAAGEAPAGGPGQRRR
jgi:hypothetical protein